MADKYQTLSSGEKTLVEATVVSTGVSQAGDIIALGTDGKLDNSVLPAGVGPDVKNLEASEDLSAGEYINIFDVAGTAKVRLADNSNNRAAHGYVLAAVTAGNQAEVFFEGANTAAASGTAGQRAYLGTAGGVITTALDEILPAYNGKLSQFLGVYQDTNEINTDIADTVTL